MKSNKANDWKVKLRKHKTDFLLKNIEVNGILSQLNSNISFICGLNGVKKTYLLKKISNIVSDYRYKFQIPFSLDVKIMCSINDKEFTLPNDLDNLYLAYIENIDIYFVDSYSILTLQKFLVQDNVDDFFLSNEVIHSNTKDVEEISFLSGKKYNRFDCVNILDYSTDDSINLSNNDENEEVDKIILPMYLLKVNCDGEDYYSFNMGSGEICLLYYYFLLKNIKNDSILIIDEPETFISVDSQIKLIDLFIKFAVKKNIKFLISTHSPFIINSMDSDMILCQYIDEKSIKIINVDDIKYSMTQYLGMKSLQFKKYLLLVEDINAKIFLELILNKYFKDKIFSFEINICSGWSNIANALVYNDIKNSYHRIGVFDGDMSENTELKNKLKHDNFVFLPCNNIELYFKDNIINSKKEFDRFVKQFNIDYKHCELLKQKYMTDEIHDYYSNICRELNLKNDLVIEYIFKLCEEYDKISIEAFVSSLKKNLLNNE